MLTTSRRFSKIATDVMEGRLMHSEHASCLLGKYDVIAASGLLNMHTSELDFAPRSMLDVAANIHYFGQMLGWGSTLVMHGRPNEIHTEILRQYAQNKGMQM